jgi:hypothetical protein
MSGRKQHFIPQSLLKGFGRAGKGAKIQVVVYSHERGIFAAATDGVAAEREFYSKLAVEGEGGTLDDKITAYETPLADTLSTLRNLGDGETANKQSASEFVTHLVVRNDHLRKFMSAAGTAMFDGFAEAMSDQDRAKSLLGLAGDRPSDMFAEQMDEMFAKYGPMIAMLGMTKDQFKEWAFNHSKVNFGEFHSGMIGPLQTAFAEATGQVSEKTADAHRRSLDSSISPEPRVEKMKEYEWRVVHLDAPLILPDCVAIAIDVKGEAFPLMLAELDEAKTINVPLSSNRLLIGSKQRNDMPTNMNEVLATCAWDFFVAGDRTPEFEELRDTIRSRTGEFVTDTIGGVISEALDAPFKKPFPDGNEGGHAGRRGTDALIGPKIS